MSELIRREDVRREIQDSYNKGRVSWQDGQDLMDRITALPAVADPPWHRAEEELPKEDGHYLTFYANGYFKANWWSNNWGWMYDAEAVRYWMPIEPPKEDA